MSDTDLVARLNRLEQKIDRLLADVDFVKNRTATYLGDREALTYLVDESPIYVNSDDTGCPASFINGGRWEEEYFSILASFRRPDSVFLDIGANLGVFSLRMVPYVRRGRIYAFEPNPRIRSLLARSAQLGGSGHRIDICDFGLSDRDAHAELTVPVGHAGGAGVDVHLPDTAVEHYPIQVRRLDGWLPPNVRVDIVKIDVEGHELDVLRGMIDVLRRSERAAVLFEKLEVDSGIEEQLAELFHSLGMQVYRADQTTLHPVEVREFVTDTGYFLACRPATLEGHLQRSFIAIYPGDLTLRGGRIQDGSLLIEGHHERGETFFHGPYWHLPRGSYRLELEGRSRTPITLSVAECRGNLVESVELQAGQSHHFHVARDLVHFELVGRGCGGLTDIAIDRFVLSRTG